MIGFAKAQKKAADELGISSHLIMCFLRHLSEESGFETLEESKSYLHMIKAVGLDSSEKGNPPEKFESLFKQCRS